MTTPAELQQFVEFDCPFRVDYYGALSDALEFHAPEVYHSDADDIEVYGTGWAPLTGYTGQYSYNGAVMHASEYLGGRLADDILSTPGVYVVVVVNVWPTVTFPHHWSPSGARCTECGLIGNGSYNGSCEAHPDYDATLVADDEDPEPAGWATLRLSEIQPTEQGETHE